MRTLGAIVEVHLLLLLRRGRGEVGGLSVVLWVGNACWFPEHGDTGAVPEADLVMTVSAGSRCWQASGRTKKVAAVVMRT
jgi:hypothetical protein